MRLDNILSETQINELGLISGIKGAVSGYKASQSQRKGAEHSDRIVANLKGDFMKLVGGGQPATYDNLIKFLGTHGLQELDTLTNPSDPTGTGTHTGLPPEGTTPATTPPGERVEPTLDPEAPGTETPDNKQAELKARLQKGDTLSSRTVKGFSQSRVGVPVQKLVGKNPDGSPKFNVVREFANDPNVLNNAQIDKIIRDAVKKNYSRIVAAQRGLPPDEDGQQTATQEPASPTQTSATAEPAATPNVTAANPFSDPDKLAEEWSAYVAGGGTVNPKLRRLARDIMGSKKPAPVEPKAEVTPPAETKPTQAELDADHERMASGANESIGYSRFLGMKL